MKICEKCSFYPCTQIAELRSDGNSLSQLKYYYGLLDFDNVKDHDLSELKCDLCMMECVRREIEEIPENEGDPKKSLYPDYDVFLFGYFYCRVRSLYLYKLQCKFHLPKWCCQLWMAYV